MLLRWNTPQYPRICPSTTTHCTHSAHENGLHHQAPLRCLPGPDQTKGPLCCARRSSVATTPHAQARQTETRVDQGLAPNKSSVSRLQTFGDLIDLHITDMCEVGKPPRRSKAATLITLRRDLGKERTDSSGLASTLGGTGARGRTSPTAPSVASTIATG